MTSPRVPTFPRPTDSPGSTHLPGSITLGPVVDEDTAALLIVGRLRNTLRLNALTSAVGGLACVVLGGPISSLLGTGHSILVRLVGAGLVLFALGVAAIAGARLSQLRRWTPIVTTADVSWVVLTAITIALAWYSTIGVVIVGAVGCMVAMWAVLQTTAWRHIRTTLQTEDRQTNTAIDASPPVEVFHVEREVIGSHPIVWEVVTDHELYGRLAPNLSNVHIQSGAGENMVRVCSNNKGEQWSETCTLWDDGQRFEVTVRTDNYPYPLALMRGSWWVKPSDANQCIVGMDFRYQPCAGAKGRVFAALMQAAFPSVLKRILNGWQKEVSRRSTPSPPR